MSARTKVDENLYKIIKTLAESGASKTDICELCEVSGSTYHRIMLSSSLKDYRRIVNEGATAKASARKVERHAEKEEAVEVDPSEAEAKVGAQLQTIVELLNSINAKLRTSMSEQTSKKRSLFRR